MRHSLLIIIVISLFGGSLSATSIDTLYISPEEYRAKVLEYSFELKKSDEEIYRATKEIGFARSGMLPQLSGELNFNYIIDNLEFKVSDYSFELSHYNYGAAATLAQNIYSGGALRIASRMAKIGSDIAIAGRLLTVDNIMYGADYAYWSLAAVIAYYDMSERYLAIVKEAELLVSDRYENGLVSKNDLLLIETRVNEAERNHSQLKGSVTNAIIAFNIMMGVPPNYPIVLNEKVYISTPTLPMPISTSEALAKRGDLIMAQYRVALAEEELRAARNNYMPQLSVGVMGNYQTQSINFNNNLQLSGAAFAKAQIPIFAGGARRYQVAKASSSIRSSEHSLGQVRDNIVKEITTAISDIESSGKELIISKRGIDSANESLELSSYSFSEGQISIIDLMQAQIAWLSAVNSTIAASYKYHISLSAYNKATGNYANE